MTRSCFVPGCKTGYESTWKRQKEAGLKRPSIFKVPKDPVLFRMWEIAIRRKDKRLSKTDSVCQLHFNEADIQRYYETKLADGTIHKMEKGRLSLKPGVVPSIFPENRITVIKNLPKINTVDNSPKNKNTYSINTVPEFSLERYTDENYTCQTNFKKFFEPVKEAKDNLIQNNFRYTDENYTCQTNFKKFFEPVKEAKVNLIQNNFESITSDGNNDNIYLHVDLEENFSYKKLCESLIMIQKPNDWWCITTTFKYVVCAKWNLKHVVQKTIIIDENLLIKVYLREREIVIPDLTKIASIDDVSALLRRVERFNVCAGVNRFKDCLVCLLICKETGARRKWCNPCKKSLKKEFNDKRTQNRNIKAEREKRRTMELINERRRNKRLLIKVNKLRCHLKIYEKICPSVKSEVDKIFITTESEQNAMNTANIEDEDSCENIECEIIYN